MDSTVTLICPLCNEDDPNEFGICRSRKSGRNRYCKRCAADKMRKVRDRKHQMKRAQRYSRWLARRSAARKCPPIIKPDPLTPVGKVQKAISEGHNTRESIRKRARLTEDQVSNALAILVFDTQQIGVTRDRKYPVFYIREAA